MEGGQAWRSKGPELEQRAGAPAGTGGGGQVTGAAAIVEDVTDQREREARAQQLIQGAQGEATAFDKVYAQYKLAPEVTRRRMYYETMERVLSQTDKVIVETPNVMSYLPLPGIKQTPPADTTVSSAPNSGEHR